MAKSSIIVNKLILTVHGSDYALTDIQAPVIYSDYVSAWETAFLSAASNVEYAYTVKRYQNSESDHIVYDTLQSIAQTGNLDLLPYCKSLSNGEEFYIWREDVGRGIRVVVRNVNGSYTVLAYVYGTYTNMNGFPNTGTSESGNADVTPTSKAGFAFDSDSGKYVFYIQTCANESNLVKPAYYAGITYQGVLFPSAIMASVLYVLLNGNAPTPPSGDPYEQGGTSTPGGGGGSFDDSSDTISVPSAPLLNLTTSKMLNAYVISVQDLNDLADYLWGNFDKTDSSKVLSKIFADPTDAILGLFMLPFTPSSSSAIPVTVGGYLAGDLEFSPISAQFKDVDCGSVTFEEYWGNYLDYNPYTRLTLFLPGVGEVQLDPDEVMGKTVSVKYRVDCLTGQFVAFVYGDNKIFSQYQGVCSLQVPVSSADYSRLNTAIMQAAVTAVGGAVGIAQGASAGAATAAQAGTEMAGSLLSSALNVLNSKVNHSHSGSLTGASFFMGSQKPYVIIHRARQSVPVGANAYYGYPSNVSAVLGGLSGFTKVKDVILDGLPLTEAELSELRGILSAGIYV